MADLIPSNSGTPGDDDRDDRDPRVVGLDSDEADDLLAAIASATARSVLASLHESPATPSELANDVDTSLQNVQYHLGNLSEAELIEVIDTRYSEKGREMNVYAPADRALVVVAGRDDETKGLKGALSRLIGGIGVLGIGSAVVNRLARSRTIFPFATGSAGGEAETADSGAAVNDSASTVTDLNATYQTNNTTAGGQTTAATSGGEQTVTETAAETAWTAPETAAETATQTPTPTLKPTATPTPAADTTTVAQQLTETTTELTTGSSGLGETVASLSPGALFFLGGLTVLLAWVVVGVLRD
ncbi:ArsR family transcriptional regulator [Haloferax mediterranei ATCC 33500]|uniref:ArsR family regulatory protein n=1 Tax=Haloferax mediterranei (strain ATCC 33500 / DSM 1411 / JCM 8866 / NBRC 14739 / NCIMB 2177 / R-4) TaxID=523841 RepID=I3R183_HALMT|nr:winged helix-turn-helix domain-containing protein [Haloferax mediterranei]AFK17993.1 ArsR family regulatory protein [Haloferax mediterranei ATCC 33500]AHZ22588.1 ArsR family transcriptional regulator [Haloferax mediterranei ATCC 33500]EMA02731.1 ArsR family regulatory protein [Haloferax mediterranei ATCC 33500]MDX5988085.1 winged helix-turn-helix domain-containing protein [Haloferax mediterranei ATCC 33500]QCQ74539.1 ArsR family transcriptional regulator [Haloferax mediterranei ATCC 33500]